jgi:hypothetical protein
VFDAFSLHRESTDLDPGRWTPHFWGGSITTGIRARSGLNTYSKHLKITTTLCRWGSLSLYKDYSSLLRWQANIFIHIPLRNCINEGMQWFGVLVFFLVYEIILLVMVLVELLGLVYASFCLWKFGCLCLVCWTLSGYESTNGPWWGWFGMQVLVR